MCISYRINRHRCKVYKLHWFHSLIIDHRSLINDSITSGAHTLWSIYIVLFYLKNVRIYTHLGGPYSKLWFFLLHFVMYIILGYTYSYTPVCPKKRPFFLPIVAIKNFFSPSLTWVTVKTEKNIEILETLTKFHTYK